MPNVLVIHPNGTLIEKRARVAHLTETVPPRAYWRDLAKTVLVIVSTKDDEPIGAYEYGGKKSYNGRATQLIVHGRNGVITEAPIEDIDRTGIPVRQAGGAKVMQLKALKDRRTTGQHVPRHDRLWRPARG